MGREWRTGQEDVSEALHKGKPAATDRRPLPSLTHSFTLDFIITGRTKALLEGEVKPLVEQFLQPRGLELSPKKTVITHKVKGEANPYDPAYETYFEKREVFTKSRCFNAIGAYLVRKSKAEIKGGNQRRKSKAVPITRELQEFSATIRKIRSRTSLEILLRTTLGRALEIARQ
jgi:hypothetical protein